MPFFVLSHKRPFWCPNIEDKELRKELSLTPINERPLFVDNNGDEKIKSEIELACSSGCLLFSDTEEGALDLLKIEQAKRAEIEARNKKRDQHRQTIILDGSVPLEEQFKRMLPKETAKLVEFTEEKDAEEEDIDTTNES